MRYVALLRGINVGKNRRVGMEDLRRVFEAAGYSNVRTLLISGNVIFDAAKTREEVLVRRLEQALSKALGFDARVIVRSSDEIEQLVGARPFAGVKLTAESRPNVTFLKAVPKVAPAFLAESRAKGYGIVRVVDRAICYVVELPQIRTPDVMLAIEKAFGKDATTRTWNVVEKIDRALQREPS